MVFLVDAIQPNHAAIGVDSGGFGRLIKAPHRGQKSSTSNVNLAAFFALDSLHSLSAFPDRPRREQKCLPAHTTTFYFILPYWRGFEKNIFYISLQWDFEANRDI